LSNCDDEHRRQILRVLALLDDRNILSRITLSQDPDPSLVLWLLSELANDDPEVVAVTCHVLLIRSSGNRAIKLEPLVTRVPLENKPRTSIRANQLLTSQQNSQLLQRLAVACASQGYRFFGGKGGVEGLAFDELAS
jgi:hypothetical protein